MIVATHEIDPDGDIILKLTHPNAPFAVWPKAQDEKVASNGQRDATDDPKADGIHDVGETPEGGSEPASEVDFRLSSRHLILASSYFKSMLCGPWKEGKTNGSEPRVVTAESWDQDALLIVMNVIHGRNKRVPREVDFETLAKIAVILDYYQCHEALEVFTDMWLRSLKHAAPLPTAYGRDAVLWLHIAHVLSDDGTARAITKMMQCELDQPLFTLGLPIPASVGDRLEAFRIQSVDYLLTQMHTELDCLARQAWSTCSPECDLMRLGALTSMLVLHNSLSRPTLPFHGKSVGKMISIIEEYHKQFLRSVERSTPRLLPTHCNCRSCRPSGSFPNQNKCRHRQLSQAVIEDRRGAMIGFGVQLDSEHEDEL
ncbi:hypothetical protein JDV02_008265 [Purpureocillium takamizusanense]|uniref:BTB domain-containing protein n=1 Tax=Purpureocillium takamizusanense TaxID=2060973 RepID=A0A9Q8VEY0_9HYPO|nr:uncharacterized protein JDV02_008265 [Purpureocillium takamizusanense]UNI22369.1 hypothetical protein JDV02_008265 [Purpureocillium takamizusanense]